MDIIIEICNNEKCTGCAACFNACRHDAIEMISDEEGFLHPLIKDCCVGCGRCVRVCPVNNPARKYEAPLSIYSGWSKNEEIRLKSASGGAFMELAMYFIKNLYGIVFGVALNDKLEATHIAVESVDDLAKLQGSKYLQSKINESYRQAEQYLIQGRNVLFSGTPCQIAGLKNYLKKEFDNLLTVDLICHGVPSKRIFDDYINYLEEKLQHKVYDVKFRCKKNSWVFYNMAVNSYLENKNHQMEYEYEGAYYSDPFIRAFLRDNILRLSCYQCLYTSISRVADFTLADWWGYKAENKEDYNFEKSGVSLIFANSFKANRIVTQLSMSLKARTLNQAMRTNVSLRKPFKIPTSRNIFWDEYKNKPFKYIVEKWFFPERLSLSQYFYYKMKPSLYRNIIITLSRLGEKIAEKLHVKIITISA